GHRARPGRAALAGRARRARTARCAYRRAGRGPGRAPEPGQGPPRSDLVTTSTLEQELARAREIAAAVPDPELPMLTLGDLGILREVTAGESGVVVWITPTYSGCPALREMSRDVAARLTAAGLGHVQVRTALSPPWSTDWITPAGRRKLAEAGIAPPGRAPRR